MLLATPISARSKPSELPRLTKGNHVLQNGKSDAFSSGFVPPSQTLFAPVLQLAAPGPDRAERAIHNFDHQLWLQQRIWFHPELNPALTQITEKLPPRESTLIRSAALYSRPDIPWRDQPPDIHEISVAGRPDGDDFLYSLTPRLANPEASGDFAGFFALRPVERDGDGAPSSVIGTLGGELNLEGYGAAQVVDSTAAVIHEVYGDLEPPWDNAPGVFNHHDRAALARFRRDLPRTATLIDHYLEIDNIIDEFSSPSGPVVLFNFDGRVRQTALEPYKHLHAFYAAAAPRVTAVSTIDDSHAHHWLRISFDRGRIRMSFMEQSGLLVPFDDHFRPAGSPVALNLAGIGTYQSVAWIHVRSLGMTFGLDNLSFATGYHRDSNTVSFNSHMSAVPQVVAPPVVRQVLILMAGEFMRVLATGNDGRGLTAHLDSRGDPGTAVRIDGALAGEFRYAPTLEFLARIGDEIADKHNEDVRADERRLGEEFFNAFVADYHAARPQILALDPAIEGAKR